MHFASLSASFGSIVWFEAWGSGGFFAFAGSWRRLVGGKML